MKIAQISISLTTIMLTLAAGSRCVAQDAGGKPDEKQMMADMMAMAQPGENHKILQEKAGTWNYKVKWWMSPDAPPMESTGTTKIKTVMDGRYIVGEHSGKMSTPGPDGKMMDSNFLGMGTEGYDNAKKKYVASWIDNMGTGIMSMEGTYDPATKTLTYVSQEQSLPGVKFKMRQTDKAIDKDHRVMQFFEVHGDAEVKVMEISYSRA